jgi:PAS domain S-box-containing protein
MVLKKEIASQIKNILKKNPQGLSITDIVRAVNINRNTAGRYLENLLVSGQVEMRRFGMAKIYMLSQRVPLSAVLSISSELVLQLDSSLRIIFANEPFLKLVGTDSINLLGKNIEYTPVALVFEESFPAFIENIREGITGKEWSGEIAFNEKELTFFYRIAPTVFEDGRKGVSVIFEDITEKQRSDYALRESEKRYRTLAEASTDLIFVIDKDDRVEYVNSYASAVANKPADQIIGRQRSVIFPPEVARNQKKALEKVFETGISLRREGALAFDGRIHWFDHFLTPLKNADNQVRSVLGISRDITERKKAEEALRRSEEKFRNVFDRANDAILLHTLTVEESPGRFIEVNRIACRMLGYERNELLTLGPPDIVPDAFHPLLREIIREAATKESFLFETRLLRKNGTTFPAESSGHLVTYEGKKIWISHIRDTTERKRAERSLKESEERYHQLVDISPDAVIIHREGKLIFANPAALNLIGALDSGEIIGKNILDFVQSDFRDTVRTTVEKDLTGEITPPMEIPMFRIDGTPVIVEGRGVKTFIDGEPAIQVAIRDITERKHAETALRESEERLRLLLDSTEDLIFMQDPEGRYLYFNAAARYGISIEETVGATPYDFLDREAAGRIVERVKKVAKTGLSISEETPFVWKGKTIWFIDNLSPVKGANGTVSAIVTISHNITDRKRAETALRESEEKYRTLVDRANDVICVVQDGIIKMCNPRLTEFWGGPVDEMLGRPFTDFVHPDALSEVINYYNRRMSGESLPSIYETILRHKDNSRSYVELNATRISYEGKNADLVIIRDMNERKKTDEALRESETIAHALINAPTDSVILTDTQGVILALNETAALHNKKRSDEEAGILTEDFLLKEVPRSRQSIAAQVLEKKKMVRFEDELDGKWYDTVAFPIVNETGDPTRIAIIARDITDRKTTEEALIHGDQRFQNLITVIGDIVWETDRRTRFVYVSPTVETILGYRPDEMIGHTPFEFLHRDAIVPNQKKFQTAIERHEKSVLQVSYWIHKDGHEVLLESNAIPLYDSKGIFSGFMGIVRQRL